MVGALMSSAPAAVLSCVNQTAQHGQVHVRFRHHSRVLEGRTAPGCATPIRFPLRALSPCLNDDRRRIPCKSGKLGQLSELRTTTNPQARIIVDAKLGAVTPDRRGIVTDGLQLSTAQTKRAFASEAESNATVSPSGPRYR